MNTAPDPGAVGFDADALRARYRAERGKRLRSEGNAQYLPAKGPLAHFEADPFLPVQPRTPLHDTVDVLVVGGGFSGLLAAVRLQQAGARTVRVVERGGDFGGTWYWNRYPGAQCDIESYIYLPLLEELGTLPARKYSDAPEIFAHCRAIGQRHGLYEQACFHTSVTELRWDEAALAWTVRTDRGDAMRARFVCLADGPISQPKLPGIAGIHDFRGRMFHASRWDYGYTGAKLERLAGRRVGVIGTGATAIQCVPFLAEAAGALFVFQRTPSVVLPRDNQSTDAAWAAGLRPGWQWERMRNFNQVAQGIEQEHDAVADGLSTILRKLGRVGAQALRDQVPLREMERRAELADFEQMEEVRSRVARIVADPATAAALQPWYRLFCKRPTFNDAYLQAFNRPSVTLVDTDGRGVERLTADAVVAGGRTWPIDCLVLATGFEVGTAYPRRSGFEAYGRDGLTLTAKWADGVRTLHGLQTAGFPNLFFLGITQGGYTANFTHMLYEQAAHVAHVVGETLRRGALAVEVTPEGEEAWVSTMCGFVGGGSFLQECTPGYYNNEGRPGEGRGAQVPLIYGGGAEAFFALLADWRAGGKLEGLALRGQAVAPAQAGAQDSGCAPGFPPARE